MNEHNNDNEHNYETMKPYLVDFKTSEPIRPATDNEYTQAQSAKFGCILVNGRRCYVEMMLITDDNTTGTETMNNQQQSIDSTAPGFMMPANWYGRPVDVTNGRSLQISGFLLIGWDQSDEAEQPYCISNGRGYTAWVEHIQFDNSNEETETIH